MDPARRDKQKEKTERTKEGSSGGSGGHDKGLLIIGAKL